MALTNLHTNLVEGSYVADLRYFLVMAENPNANLAAHFEGTSIAIGYEYDAKLVEISPGISNCGKLG